MGRIRSTNTKPELLVRKFLFSKGFRYRLHSRKLAGKPDIVLPKYKVVIFVHGCFWHGHSNCVKAKTPATNTLFWLNKIESNGRRDEANVKILKEQGWEVYTVWECQLTKRKTEKTLIDLMTMLLRD